MIFGVVVRVKKNVIVLDLKKNALLLFAYVSMLLQKFYCSPTTKVFLIPFPELLIIFELQL